MPAIDIIGSGALGSLFAAHLESQAELALLSHWSQQIAVIKSSALVCIHLDGSRSEHQITITDNPYELKPVELALILVKSYQTARVAYDLVPILAPDGLVVTLQNGLGNLELLQAALGHGRVAQGVTAQGATMIEPGVVRHAGEGPTYIAATAGRDDKVTGLIDLLNQAGIPAEKTRDVRSLQWGKLAINAGINALTALLRVRNGYLAAHTLARRVMCAAAEEAYAVAQRLNIPMPYENASLRVISVAEATAENQSSMLQDVLRGAPTEINAINGAVAEHGRRIGLPTPVNTELWQLVSAVESGQTNSLEEDNTELLKSLLEKME